MSAATTTTGVNIEQEHQQFADLLAVAERCLASGNLPAAAGFAQVAARRAFPRHIGTFASPRLEHLLLDIGRQLTVPPASKTAQLAARRKNVLHVLTFARRVGGDTRFVWRWIKRDGHSRHSVAITSQNEVEHLHHVPESLREAASESGGVVRSLAAPSSDPLGRARELRSLCMEQDVVVLHLYPNDIVPVLALAAGCESVKVALSNLADHTFWIGASVTNLIVHLRTQPPGFLASRRGLHPPPSPILPIPLESPPAEPTRDTARRELGIAPDQVLLVTIATPFKYESLGGPSFLELVMPVLRESPHVVLVAVGPDSQGAWRAASLETGGRVRPLGTKWDNDALYVAADVYLDSYPFSSITSLLEAGSRGVPLLSCVATDPDLALLGPGAPGLDGVLLTANGPEAYQCLLARLIDDPEFRQQSGARARANILKLHCDDPWTSILREVYRGLDASTARIAMDDAERFQTGALDVALARLYAGHDRGSFRDEVQHAADQLPYRERALVLAHLARRGFRPRWQQFLPGSLELAGYRIAAALRRVARR